jgi:hypothetical protein
MGNAENKSEFITQLFLYYKPILTKEKQTQLLTEWLGSCLQSEEYEMANTIKLLMLEVDDSVGGLEVTPIPNNLELSYDSDIMGGNFPKITPKDDIVINEISEKLPKKRWKFINVWEELHGFTLLECKISLKKRTFRFIIINYGVEYS